jgi:transposase
VDLHYLHGMSYAEIAANLARPVSTVLGRLQRARKRLILVQVFHDGMFWTACRHQG